MMTRRERNSNRDSSTAAGVHSAEEVDAPPSGELIASAVGVDRTRPLLYPLSYRGGDGAVVVGAQLHVEPVRRRHSLER